MTRAARRLGATIATWLQVQLALYQDVLCELELRTCRHCRENRAVRSTSTGDNAGKEDRKS